MMIILFLLNLVPIPEDYKLQIGDEVIISVSGNINFAYSQIISPEGTIFIQSGGTPIVSPPPEKHEIEIIPKGATVLEKIKIFDLTLKEAEDLLESKFNTYFKNVEISITVINFANEVYVNGEVNLPGPYPYFPGKSVKEYVGMAGGLKKSADFKKSYIIKKDGKKMPIFWENIEPGDVIFIKRVKVKWWEDYLTIVSTVSTTVYTIIIAWLAFRR